MSDIEAGLLRLILGLLGLGLIWLGLRGLGRSNFVRVALTGSR